MRLILVRHGSTNFNENGLVLGRRDPPLTDLGLAQAAGLADVLREEPVRAVYSSPLTRARQTAEAIARASGLAAVVEPGLIEMDVGDFDGITFEQLRREHADFLERWVGDPGPLQMPRGESLEAVQERVWTTVQRLASRHSEETVAAVSHNFAILAALCRALAVPLSRFRRLRQDVASLSILELGRGTSRIVRLNDRCHLNATRT